MEEADNSKKKEPGTWMSFLVFGIAIAIILTGVVILEFDVHIVLLLALIFVCVVSATLGYSFDDLVEFMKKSLGQAMSAMIIFIFIGVIIASWIFSGTVQTLIYYGLQYISPAVFLPVGLLLCSLTSMSIGTSWGTIGTMGIAMMGIGSGMGIPPAVTAGMVISGSFFGDKMSPISDTTNLAPASAGTTLYKHISAMWKTTLPAYIISFIIFVVIGLAYQDGEINTETVAIFSDTIRANFKDLSNFAASDDCFTGVKSDEISSNTRHGNWKSVRCHSGYYSTGSVCRRRDCRSQLWLCKKYWGRCC